MAISIGNYTGAGTGIHSGGLRDFEKENYTKKGKKGKFLFKLSS